MLIGISHLINPELLFTLSSMGHGDEIVFADANFPSESLGPKVIRADGLPIVDLLKAVSPLFPFDGYVESPLSMMDVAEGDDCDPQIEREYLEAIRTFHREVAAPEKIERFAFYERAKNAFAIVATGELRPYGNILLKKGVVSN